MNYAFGSNGREDKIRAYVWLFVCLFISFIPFQLFVEPAFSKNQQTKRKEKTKLQILTTIIAHVFHCVIEVNNEVMYFYLALSVCATTIERRP